VNKQEDFRYFADFKRWAQFAEESCDCEGPCLEGVYFDDPDVPEAVCLQSLVSGEVRVDVPSYLIDRLRESVRVTFHQWSTERINAHVSEAVDTLSRTPPVPWIQNNLWPVHHGDFCRYVGEWNQEKLTEEAKADDGRTYLSSILEESTSIEDVDGLWASIGNGWTAIFVFECLRCERQIAVPQSY
jgi:uncharacterized protein CbrC (UPF0167 family)